MPRKRKASSRSSYSDCTDALTSEEAELKTMQKTLVVKNGKVVFASPQGRRRRPSLWKVYKYQTDADSGTLQYAFQHKRLKKILTLQDNHVELKPVKEVSGCTLDEKCLFEWCSEEGNKGSLRSVKEHLYLGSDEEKLIACDDNDTACVFELPGQQN